MPDPESSSVEAVGKVIPISSIMQRYKLINGALLFSRDAKNWRQVEFFDDKVCTHLKVDGAVVAVQTDEGIYYHDCSTNKVPVVSTIQNLGKLELDDITEASGIIASRVNMNVLWTHNDSGDKQYLYALNRKGSNLGRFEIKGAAAYDWEDVAVGPGPLGGKDYIYIGDIGDNKNSRDIKTIYRVVEPRVDHEDLSATDRVTDMADKIRFRYPKDKKYDSETLLLDPLTKDIYLVTKRKRKSEKEADNLFKLSYPQDVNRIVVAEKVGKVKIPTAFLVGYGAVGGDISTSGREIIIKTYTNIYYWPRETGQRICDALKRNPVELLYASGEPQGEAICWAADGEGFYTTSEELGSDAYLVYYPVERWKKAAGKMELKLQKGFK